MENEDEEAMEKLIGKPGEPVPAVDFADIKAAWAVMQDVKKRDPQGRMAICSTVYERVCSPGADIRAVCYRLSMLGIFERLLKPAYSGQWTDAALKAASTMELTWMEVGKVYKGLPFDAVAFLLQARAEAA